MSLRVIFKNLSSKKLYRECHFECLIEAISRKQMYQEAL